MRRLTATHFREEFMGGKRPDQYQIDPAEAGATDYKDRTDDEHIRAEDKENLKSNPHGQPMIPESGVNPALRDLRERKQAARGDEE